MEIQLQQYHPIIGYHFIPNLRTRCEHEGGGYLLRANSAGFRSEREFETPKAEDIFRILLFGDSFTAGDAVSNKYRYGDVLETLLPGLEVFNFGLPGTGTDQHYLVYKELARDYECDLIVIAVQVENIRRVAARYRLAKTVDGADILLPKPYFEFGAGGELVLKNTPVPKEPLRPEDLPEGEHDFVDRGGRMFLLRKMVGKMGGCVKQLAQQLSHYQPLPEYDKPDGREWLLLKAILRKWTSETDKPVIIMPVPLYHYVEETASAEGVTARFAELGSWENVILHDPLPDYYSVPKSERRRFRFENDIHPTPAHHRLLAESLAAPVQELLDRKAGGAASI